MHEAHSPTTVYQGLERLLGPARISPPRETPARVEGQSSWARRAWSGVTHLLRKGPKDAVTLPFRVVDILAQLPKTEAPPQSPALPPPQDPTIYRRQKATIGIVAGIIGGLTAVEVASRTKNPLEGAVIGAAAGFFAANMFYRRVRANTSTQDTETAQSTAWDERDSIPDGQQPQQAIQPAPQAPSLTPPLVAPVQYVDGQIPHGDSPQDSLPSAATTVCVVDQSKRDQDLQAYREDLREQLQQHFDCYTPLPGNMRHALIAYCEEYFEYRRQEYATLQAMGDEILTKDLLSRLAGISDEKQVRRRLEDYDLTKEQKAQLLELCASYYTLGHIRKVLKDHFDIISLRAMLQQPLAKIQTYDFSSPYPQQVDLASLSIRKQ